MDASLVKFDGKNSLDPSWPQNPGSLAPRYRQPSSPGKATKANGGQPLIVAGRPWENPDVFRLGSVIRDGDRFRMWHQMNHDLFGYAESEDGLRWKKLILLDRVEYQASETTTSRTIEVLRANKRTTGIGCRTAHQMSSPMIPRCSSRY